MPDVDLSTVDESTIREVVRDELEQQSQTAMDSIPFTRREIVAGFGILGAGATLGAYGAVGRAAASNEGSGSIGTNENPLEAIYVNELHQNTDHITAESLTTEEVSIGGDWITATDSDHLQSLIGSVPIGTQIRLLNKEYEIDDISQESVILKGTQPMRGATVGTELSPETADEITVSGRSVNIHNVSLGGSDLAVTAGRFYGMYIDTMGAEISIGDDSAGLIVRGGSVTFESGTSGGWIIGPDAVTITDNGNNEVVVQ